jgi:cytochrome c
MRNHVFTLGISVVLALAATASNAALDDASGQNLLKKGTCSTCHKTDKKAVGPSFKEIAAKHKGQSDAVARLEKVIRAGSKGAYGDAIAMPGFSTSKLSDPEVHDLAEWILSK